MIKDKLKSANESIRQYPYQNLSLMDMEGETWKFVPDFEEYYAVSNMGRIKSLERTVKYADGRISVRKERILKQTVSKNFSNLLGKFSFSLSIPLKVHPVNKHTKVSRIVYFAFTKGLRETENEKLFILHRDLDPFNNRIENLYIATGKEVTKRNLKEGFTKISTPEFKAHTISITSKPVSQYTLDGNFIRSFPSVKEASRVTGVDETPIINTARAIHKHAGGFIWRYGKSKEKLDDRILAGYMTKATVKQYDGSRLVCTYRTTRHVMKSLNYTEYEYLQLRKLLKQGHGTAFFKGYTWKYASL